MTFILRDPKAVSRTTIHLHLYLSDGRIKYPTGQRVVPGNWDQKIGRVIKDRDKVNIVLNRIENRLQELYLNERVTGVPITKSSLIKEMAALLQRSGRVKKDIGFWTAVEGIIRRRERGEELTKKGKRFSAATIKGYRHTVNMLYAFDKRLSFESITEDTYNSINAYYNQKNYAVNSLGKIIKNLKVFMDVAYRDGLHSNTAYKRFRVVEELTHDIYLTMDELERIHKKNLPNKTLALVRDWFILDCMTGLRISDIQLLSPEHIEGDTIRLHNEKTGVKVVIPMHSWVKEILKRHRGVPRKITDQKMNQFIKDVALLSGIRGKEVYSSTKGGRRQEEIIDRHRMVSNHTARRSFITNLLKAGVPHTQVMKLAGIVKMETLMKYDKLSAEENAEILRDHSFFSGK